MMVGAGFNLMSHAHSRKDALINPHKGVTINNPLLLSKTGSMTTERQHKGNKTLNHDKKLGSKNHA